MEYSIVKYLIEWGIGSLILFGIYYFFLKNETYFKLNRLFLLSALILSAIIPLLNFQATVIQENIMNSVMLDTINVGGKSISEKAVNSDFSFLSIAFKIYIVISFLLLFRLLKQVISIITVIKKYGITTINNTKYVFTDNEYSDFSFLNIVFLKEDTKQNHNFEKIKRHERVHANQLHSLDIILTELIIIFQWFNPVIWFYRKALKQTHEYLADEGVLEQGYDSDKYQLLLLEQQIGVQPGLVNNFNKSLTLKRLTMMNKIKSSKIAKLKLFAIIPVLTVLFLAFSCDKVEEATDADNNKKYQYVVDKEKVNDIANLNKSDIFSIDTVTFPDDNMNDMIYVTTKANAPSSEIEEVNVVAYGTGEESEKKTYQIVEEMPVFPGGDLALRKFIAINVKYPAEARNSDIQGKVYIRFVVSSDGSVKNVSIARGVDKILDDEAIRVVSLLPKWKPGKQGGKAVDVYYTVPINFALQ